ncbi:MAG: hypothetical protein JST55_14430 [Bacteroidetes bacterium]|nr:hypothetical protein [Bacteroidota bacterium]
MRKSNIGKWVLYILIVLFVMCAGRGYGQSDSVKYVMPELPPQPPSGLDDNVNNTVPLSIEESAWMEADGLKWELKLSDDQYKEVHKIVLAALKKKEKLWDAGAEKIIDNTELEERLDKIDEGMDAQLKDVVTAEQFEKYMSRRKKLKSK